MEIWNSLEVGGKKRKIKLQKIYWVSAQEGRRTKGKPQNIDLFLFLGAYFILKTLLHMHVCTYIYVLGITVPLLPIDIWSAKYRNCKICSTYLIALKFIYSEKATKFCKISTLLLSYVVPVKSKVEISQNFVAFLEYMNFNYNEPTELPH